MLIKYIDIPKISDSRGSLSPMEVPKDIPFSIRRIYTIYDLKNDGSIRGEHAHKEAKQVLFCLKGSVTIGFDDGISKEKVRLDLPNRGIFIPKMIWHWMEGFSDDCILLVIASELYDEADYFRDYNTFISQVC